MQEPGDAERPTTAGGGRQSMLEKQVRIFLFITLL